MSAFAPLFGDEQTSGERVENDAHDPSRKSVGRRPAQADGGVRNLD